MSEFVVHSIPGSPFGRAVLATLEEKRADYRFAPLAPGTLKVEPHIKRHPFGRIPVLEHGSFTLYEAAAILRYLDRIIPTPALTPSDPKAAARMDQLLNISDWYLFLGGGNVIGFQRVVGPRLLGMTPDEAAIAEALPSAHKTFAELSRLLGVQSYMTGSAVSLADIMLAAHLDFFSQTPEWAALTADAANLVTWLERMNERPSMKATTWDAVAQMGVPA